MSASHTGPPSWLPPAVVAEVKLLAKWKIIDDTDRLILSELANWDEMERVWRELKRYTPLPEPAQLRAEWRYWHKGDELDGGWSDRDIALMLVFFWAFFFASVGARMSTSSEHGALFASYQKQAHRLRAGAVELRERHNRHYDMPEAKEHAQAVECVAAFCEAQATELTAAEIDDPANMTVQRDYLPAQGFCYLLAGRLGWLYGEEFYTILAILANAALNPQTPVTATRVRDCLTRSKNKRTTAGVIF